MTTECHRHRGNLGKPDKTHKKMDLFEENQQVCRVFVPGP
jgi:hypothetical protein